MTHTCKRMTLTAVLISGVAISASSSANAADTEPYVIAGQGGPVVVFDAGFGDNRQTWEQIIPAIAAETTAFAFERPGYLVNENVINPADVANDGITTLAEQAEHLHALLAAAKLSPPYMLVGHSLGGTTLLAFAKNYPDEVAGMVFVDGRMPTFSGICEAAGISSCAPTPEFLAGMPTFMRAEIDGVLATQTTEAASVAELGAVPATFLVALRANDPADPESERMQRVWIGNQRSSAESMRDGRYIEVAAGHYVHREQPQLVIDEISKMLARVRTGAWPK